MSALTRLIQRLKELPGIGEKSAQRITRYILRIKREEAAELSEAILAARDKTRTCERCGNLTEDEFCEICKDPSRVQTEICVVEEAFDIPLIERAGVYQGLYHVLGGVLSPMEDVSADELRIAELVGRVRQEGTKEVILATSATTEGETTALYVAGQLKGMGIRVSRIARGIPAGADLGLADEVTISRALSGRKSLDSTDQE
ncbi:MAG: recombination mediator RecR [candidate division WOR-3 bacterium]|nr:recombination mediator RecR [candidate division WOR-3 bacterium]